jgi:hypothetical protein
MAGGDNRADSQKRANRDERRQENLEYAGTAFREAMIRFDGAGVKILAASRAIEQRPQPPLPAELGEDTVVYQVGPVDEAMHLELAHAWEEYFAAFYSALNKYAAFLRLLVDHRTRQALDAHRMKAWLRRLAELFPDLAADIGVVESGRHHRGKWLDHPQVAGAGIDWMTQAVRKHGMNFSVPIRLKMKAGPRRLIWNGGVFDPWTPGYRPPIDCEEVGVPPCPVCLAGAFMGVVRATSKRFDHDWDDLPDLHVLADAHFCDPPPPDPPPEVLADVKKRRWECAHCGQRWHLRVFDDSTAKRFSYHWQEVERWDPEVDAAVEPIAAAPWSSDR